MKNRTLTMMQLEVSSEDIQAMEDHDNSGMCDRSTAIAIFIALRKRFRAKYAPKIFFALHHNSCKFSVGEETYPLPQNLYWWLRESENGVPMKPS
jgi:hypothetical protein